MKMKFLIIHTQFIMKHVSIVLFFLMAAMNICAQPFSAFTDVRQEFFVFDNGAKQRLEPLAPADYKIGRSAVAYLDNQRIFKVYRDGNLTRVNDLFTTEFQVSDNLVLYRSANIISVVDGNDIVLLSRLCDRYAMGDSIVLFYDMNRQTFNGYYNGKITELENFMNIRDGDFAIGTNVKVSDNIGAYINYNDQFKVFYNNNLEELENQVVKDFQVGRNIVAYVDINNIFKIYYAGHSYTVDPFAPISFQAGDDVVAFQGNDGYFKIFYKGSIYSIGYYQPQYRVADRVVSFEDVNKQFKIFYEGEQTWVDNYYPEKVALGYNSMAYIDRANMLRLFSSGKMYDVSNTTIQDYRLDYDVLQYKVGFNTFRMFYNGENYN